MDLGNRTLIINSVLDCVKLIEDKQNSPDMQVYKGILTKLALTMLNDFSNPAEAKIPSSKPDFSGERPENFNSETCQVFQDKTNGQCDCGNGSCAIPQTDKDLSRTLPEFNIQDTIAKIKDEIDAESKDQYSLFDH